MWEIFLNKKSFFLDFEKSRSKSSTLVLERAKEQIFLAL